MTDWKIFFYAFSAISDKICLSFYIAVAVAFLFTKSMVISIIKEYLRILNVQYQQSYISLLIQILFSELFLFILIVTNKIKNRSTSCKHAYIKYGLKM